MNTIDRLFRVGTASALCALALPTHAGEAKNTDQPSANTEAYEEVIVRARATTLTAGVAATPHQLLTGDEFVLRRQGGLGETLAGMPGVHLDNFGAGASRPVIRGQTLPRIEILSNGATVFDVASISPDHAISADPLLLDGIEVVRGPAAAIYGGNALNGAINLIDSKIPRELPANGLSGALETRYGAADNERSAAGRLTVGAGAFALHIEGLSASRDDYEVPGNFGVDTLKDSFADNSAFSIGGSWIRDNGYIGVSYTRQDSDYGLPGHTHENAACHTHGLDLHCAVHGPFTNALLEADDSHSARIALENERIDLRADYDNLLPGVSHLRLRASYTDYRHNELDGDFLFSAYGNEVYDTRLEFTHTPLFGFTGTLGMQYTDATFTGLNLNSAHKGNQPQEFVSDNKALFFTEHRAFGPVDIEFSARKDWRDTNATFKDFENFLSDIFGLTIDELDLIPEEYMTRFRADYPERFYRTYPASTHNPFSVALGAVWNMQDGYAAGLTLARSQRAPSSRELYALGNNLATNSYEVGIASGPGAAEEFAPALVDKEETVRSADLMLRRLGGATEFEVGVFLQDVSDYVYNELIEQEGSHRYLRYRMGDARFWGVDGQLSHAIDDNVKITLFGDYVRADLRGAADNLPRVPPGRLGMRLDWRRGALSVGGEYYQTFAQDRIASYETQTGGYGMLNASVAYRLPLGDDRALQLFARGSNLTDKLAFVHTSFVKEQSPLRGRSVTLGARVEF